MLDSTSPYREYVEQFAPDYWRNDPRLRDGASHSWWVLLAQALLTGGVLSLLLWQIAFDQSLIGLVGAGCAVGLAMVLYSRRQAARQQRDLNAYCLAHFDCLTGLSNRFQILQSLEMILAGAGFSGAGGAHQSRHCAVFLIDLDRFKQVNDTLGHPAGDAVLQEVANRLQTVAAHQGLIGRLGGDEFQVILPGVVSRAQLAGLADAIIARLSEPYIIQGRRVAIGASIGIAQSPADGVTRDEIIRNADLALYAAKGAGRGRHHFYSPDLHSDAEERRFLEDALRDAVARGELELFYQPVVQTATERIVALEALLRWRHPERGWIAPAQFVPIAEDSGLIAALGEWVIRTACHDMAQWPAELRVAVNVSVRQFADPALPDLLASALKDAGVAPDRLELEITESVFLADDVAVDQMFRALKAVGVRLALDDFGTGYSSLGYLKKAPFDKIKVDQSFVRGADLPGCRNAAIVASIVELAAALEMETTAEGVESPEELDFLRVLGVSQIQGFIYEGPLSRAQMSERIAGGLSAVAQGGGRLTNKTRPHRRAVSRKIEIEHGDQRYKATISNISRTGALVRGLWEVPAGTVFRLHFPDGATVFATARWSAEDSMGVEFAPLLRIDQDQRNHAAMIATQGAFRPSGKAVHLSTN